MEFAILKTLVLSVSGLQILRQVLMNKSSKERTLEKHTLLFDINTHAIEKKTIQAD